MIFGDLQPERQKLYHPIFINRRKLTIFCGEHKWLRVAAIHEPEVTFRMHFAVKHGCNLSCVVVSLR